jgi:hypothetical protein
MISGALIGAGILILTAVVLSDKENVRIIKELISSLVKTGYSSDQIVKIVKLYVPIND